MSQLITLAEKAIALYNELKNDSITEMEMFERMDILIPEIEKAYYEETPARYSP